MRIQLYILSSLLAVAGICCRKEKRDGGGSIPPITNSQRTYLALGDSYTIGQSVPESDRFPVQTKNRLQSLGVSMADPLIIARTGWTTENLKDALDTQKPVGPYDLVTLLIGVNDQYQRQDTTGYRARFADLLARAILLAGSRRDHVVVLSIPDYSVTPFASFSDTAMIRTQIGWFNAINKEVTAQNLCGYLDITPSSREALNDRSLLAADGLHPSGLEYRKWAERLSMLVKNIL